MSNSETIDETHLSDINAHLGIVWDGYRALPVLIHGEGEGVNLFAQLLFLAP